LVPAYEFSFFFGGCVFGGEFLLVDGDEGVVGFFGGLGAVASEDEPAGALPDVAVELFLAAERTHVDAVDAEDVAHVENKGQI